MNVFIDNWVLERLLDDSSLRARLIPGDQQSHRAVLSPWHLYEIGKDGNRERARRKALLVDELTPLWLKTPLQCRETILSEELWVYLGLTSSPDPINPFSEDLTAAIEEMNGERAPRPITAVIYIDYVLRYPELLEEAMDGVRKWAVATAVIRDRKDESLRRREMVLRQLIRRHLPDKTPSGVEIAAGDLDNFSERLEWKRVPLLALEEALYVAELRWHEELKESDAVDIQYVSGALLYCHLAIIDKRMAELSRRASRELGFRLAQLLKDPGELGRG